MKRFLLAILLLISVNSAYSAIYQIQILGTLNQFEDSLSDTWGLDGANYSMTLVFDDSDYTTDTFLFASDTVFNSIETTLTLSDSYFDGEIQANGNTTLPDLTARTYDSSQGSPFGDRLDMFYFIDIGAIEFLATVGINFEQGYFTFGQPNSPILLDGAQRNTDFGGGSFSIRTNNGEPPFLCAGTVCIDNPAFTKESLFIDFSPEFSISSVVPIPTAFWFFSSAITFLTLARRKQ